MALFWTTGPVSTAVRPLSTTNSCLLIGFTFLVGLMHTVAQPRGRGHPNVFALKRQVQDVVVGEGSWRVDLGHLFVRTSYQNLAMAGVLVGTISNPCVCFEIEVTQAFVRAGPHVVAAGLRGIDEVGGQAAVGREVIKPVVAVVTAHTEIGGRPEHI